MTVSVTRRARPLPTTTTTTAEREEKKRRREGEKERREERNESVRCEIDASIGLVLLVWSGRWFL